MKIPALQNRLEEIIFKAASSHLHSEVPFSEPQLDLLADLNLFCVNQVITDIEVLRDPRKLIYKSNLELQYALSAILLAGALINPGSTKREDKEFFQSQIAVNSENDGRKTLSFSTIKTEQVLSSLSPELINDWMIYRDNEGRGIKTLMDSKNDLNLLTDYQRGGDPAYEFARFERKYHEQQKRRELTAKTSAQEAFRNVLVQSVATEIAKQQILSGQNPMELVELLFSTQDYSEAIKKMAVPKTPQPLQLEHLPNQNHREPQK